LMQPTLLAQSILISPDIILIFFYLLALNAILGSQRLLLTVALIGLGSISLRGIICVAILFVCDIILNRDQFKNKKWLSIFFKKSIVYIPVTALVTTWLIWHYKETSWVGYHSDSPWGNDFQIVSFKIVLRNFVILGWRLMDFGMIAWFVALIPVVIIGYKNYKNSYTLPSHTITLLILAAVPLVIFATILSIYAAILGHRYLLPVYITLSLFVLYHIDYYFSRYKKTIFTAILLVLLTGHLWVYPEKIAMGWDATLAHYPYYKERKEMLNYIKEKNIPSSEVGVGCMNAYCNYLLDLNYDTTCFENELANKKYILYSNINNDYSDSLIDSLNNYWILEKEFKSPTVFLRLYRRPQ